MGVCYGKLFTKSVKASKQYVEATVIDFEHDASKEEKYYGVDELNEASAVDSTENYFDDYTPEYRAQKLDELRAEIAHLPEVERLEDVSDGNLIRFLRGKKYKIDESLESTKKLAAFLKSYPELTRDASPEEFLVFSKLYRIFKEKDKDGHVVVVVRPTQGAKVLTDEFIKANPLAIPRCMIWFFSTLSKQIDVQLGGVIMINTFRGMSFWDSLAMNKAATVKQRTLAFQYLQDCTAIRVKGIYIFDEPFFITWIWNIISLFLGEKLRKRFHLFGTNYAKLSEIFPGKSVNSEYLSGDGIDAESIDWITAQASSRNDHSSSGLDCAEDAVMFKRLVIPGCVEVIGDFDCQEYVEEVG